jgi:hypothetical protein
MADDVSLETLLSARYAPPEWAAFFEVDLGSRRADCVTVNLWNSRFCVNGFEIKRSRSDWLRELSDPTKMERLHRECHQIYLLVEDPQIVRDDLPAGWGLMVRQRSRLMTKVKPRWNEPDHTRRFWVRLLQHQAADRKRAVDAQVYQQLELARESLESEELTSLRNRLERADASVASLLKTVDGLKDQLRTVEQAAEWLSGLHQWERARAISAMAVVQKSQWHGEGWARKQLLSRAESALVALREAVETFEQVEQLFRGDAGEAHGSEKEPSPTPSP